jgi:hypothetical protein
VAYSNGSSADFGVNLDSSGYLSGFAYGANIGWINFQWHTPSDLETDRPRINLSNGAFTGYAYGANVGWINLGTGYLETEIPAPPGVTLQISVAGDTLTLSWQTSADGVIQASSDLTSDAWIAIGGGVPQPGGGWILQLPFEDSDRTQFFRWSSN